MRKLRLLLTIILSILILSACGPQQQTTEALMPVAEITSPTNESSFTVGEQVVIKYNAADVEGIAQVELLVNGGPIQVQVIEPPINSLSAGEIWVPETAGSYVLELRAFNVNNEASDPSQIYLNVEPAPTEEAVAVVPTETPTQVVQPPTATIEPTIEATGAVTPTQTPTLTPTATLEPDVLPAEAASLTVVSEALFVRAGPGTGFEEIGKLSQGETALITGRDTSGAWWQIVYPENSERRGWLSAGDEFTQANNASGVPVAQQTAEPAPTSGAAAQPTTAPTDTPIPAPDNPDLPIISQFTADKTNIRLGEQIVLRWELSQAREAYLQYDGNEQGVISPGEKAVTPQQDTTYTLIARNDAGETTAEVNVQVDTENPVQILSPPAIFYFSASQFYVDSDDDDDGDDEITLSWELSNAREAYLRYDDEEKGVVSPGSEEVELTRDTDFTLVARNDIGETRARLEIEDDGNSDIPDGASPPAIISLRTSSVQISRGQSVTLQWNVENASEVFLQYSGREEGVVAPGEKVISPEDDTTIVLVARNGAGETVAQFNLEVN